MTATSIDRQPTLPRAADALPHYADQGATVARPGVIETIQHGAFDPSELLGFFAPDGDDVAAPQGLDPIRDCGRQLARF